MERKGYVYIVTNKRNGTLYIGITTNLFRRIIQHKSKEIEGFTKRYGCDKLVYREKYDLITDAIAREKVLKGGNRRAKLKLIESMNPNWSDLAEGRETQGRD